MITGEHIWIIGASSGIGRALAIKLAQQNNLVIVSARSDYPLLELARSQQRIVSLPCDVTDRHSLTKAAQRIELQCEYLDRIFVNAGTCEYLDIDKPDWGMMKRVMDVNYFGAINCVAAALPLLQNQKKHKHNARPHIVATASLASDVPFPRAEAYGASKAAVKYFFESLRIDLHQDNIDVTVVQPGFVATPLTHNNDFPMPFKLSAEEAADFMVNKLEKRPLYVRFPWRLAAILRWFSGCKKFWHWLATTHLISDASVSRGTDGVSRVSGKD